MTGREQPEPIVGEVSIGSVPENFSDMPPDERRRLILERVPRRPIEVKADQAALAAIDAEERENRLAKLESDAANAALPASKKIHTHWWTSQGHRMEVWTVLLLVLTLVLVYLGYLAVHNA